MANNNRGVACVKLPDDLAEALRVRADAEGLTVSEVLRAMVQAWVYDERPSVDEGYRAGRAVGMKMAHIAVSNVISQMPMTYEDALAIIKATSHR